MKAEPKIIGRYQIKQRQNSNTDKLLKRLKLSRFKLSFNPRRKYGN